MICDRCFRSRSAQTPWVGLGKVAPGLLIARRQFSCNNRAKAAALIAQCVYNTRCVDCRLSHAGVAFCLGKKKKKKDKLFLSRSLEKRMAFRIHAIFMAKLRVSSKIRHVRVLARNYSQGELLPWILAPINIERVRLTVGLNYALNPFRLNEQNFIRSPFSFVFCRD